MALRDPKYSRRIAKVGLVLARMDIARPHRAHFEAVVRGWHVAWKQREAKNMAILWRTKGELTHLGAAGAAPSKGIVVMKMLISIAALGLASFGTASQAATVHFEPVNSAFTASGGITVTAGAVSLPCTAHLRGNIGATGNARITSVIFSGVSCAALSGQNLPWGMGAKQINKFSIRNVTVSAVVLGICGPGTVKANLTSKGGLITISGANLPGLVPCSLNGTLQSNPHLRIRAN